VRRERAAGRKVDVPFVRRLRDGFIEHDLLTFASAISFQILSSIVPFVLFGFGLLGFLSLEDVWRDELAPDVKANVSDASFRIIDDIAQTALTEKQVFWVTAGFLLALWQISGAVRAVMGALNRQYRCPARRSWRRRMGVSTALGFGIGACFLLAFAVVTVTPLLYGDLGAAGNAALFFARWGVAGALLLVAVALLVHFAPERDQPIGWVSAGSAAIILAWLVMSAAFGFYLRNIADYDSVFSNLASVVVLIGYLYASSLIFLGGIQVDALVREHLPDGDARSTPGPGEAKVAA
jgi:membrane protein